MKNMMRELSTAGLVFLSATTLAVVSANAETIRVTIASGYAETVDWTRYLDEVFIPNVDKALDGTDYEINWNRAYAGTLAKPNETVQFIGEGFADIGLAMTVFAGDVMPLHNLGYYTPFVSSDMGRSVSTMEQLQAQEPTIAQEWTKQNQVYLGGFSVSEYVIFSAEKIASYKDIDGKKIGGAGPNLSWLSNTGGVGVPAAANTTYEGLQSGAYDGIIVPLSTASSLKLHEVSHHMAEVGFGTPFLGAVSANMDFFKGLPEVVQNALRDGGAAYSARYNSEASEVANNYRQSLPGLGVEVSTLSAEAMADWAQVIENPAKAWAGSDPTRLDALKKYMAAMRAAGASPSRDWESE